MTTRAATAAAAGDIDGEPSTLALASGAGEDHKNV
jgi:hypothetical protein